MKKLSMSAQRAQRGASGMLVATRGRAKSFGKNGPSKRERNKRACRRGDVRKGEASW